MAERVGILVISYGSRGVCYADTLKRSENYDVEIYIADRQRNPLNAKLAKEHRVIPDLSCEKIKKFASRYKDKIDFCLVGPEKPIIDGIRDILEKDLGIETICPTQEYALEKSKVMQREMLEKFCKEMNPRFKVFRKEDYSSLSEVKKDLWEFLDELNNEVAVKPDKPGYGKGVGVWGDHFSSREELWQHFLSIYQGDAVIVEEKIYGEESSFQCFCDGKHLVALPQTRDYKRAFDGDKGPNTGGMGCYKDKRDYLPFLSAKDRLNELKVVEKLFKKLRGKSSNPALRGIPFYVAFIHDATGLKILEINSRGGDPEIIPIVPLLQDDFVDVCFDMIDGSLRKIHLERKAGVLIYKVPPSYGNFEKIFPERVKKGEVGKPIDISKALEIQKKYGDNARIYPGSMEIRDDKKLYALSSRTVACVGFSDDIESSREIALELINGIKGGSLWYRKDIASKEHISKSIEHMRRLRCKDNE